jgi:hypothetical protein
MTRSLALGLVLLALLALPVDAHPLVPSTNSGTLVANAFTGCTPANCDVRSIGVDAGASHTIVHTVTATHSSGFPPAFNFYLRVSVAGGPPVPISGCPDIFTPGSPGMTQTCTLPALTNATKVYGYFEALRPHMTGTVTFTHTLSGF